MSWLHYLGGRRPESLDDQAEYSEVTHDKATPKESDPPKGVKGHRVGKGAHRTSDNGRR